MRFAGLELNRQLGEEEFPAHTGLDGNEGEIRLPAAPAYPSSCSGQRCPQLIVELPVPFPLSGQTGDKYHLSSQDSLPLSEL